MLELQALALENSTESAEKTVFPWWLAVLVEPNREKKAADWLERLKVPVYLPQFARQRRARGRQHAVRMCAVLPGMLFVPNILMENDRHEEIFDYAHVRGFIRSSNGQLANISNGDIDIIRQIEAKLNAPPAKIVPIQFKVGQAVRFRNDLYAAFWGDGMVKEVVNSGRIGVNVRKLFGGPQKVYVPAAEIEVL